MVRSGDAGRAQPSHRRLHRTSTRRSDEMATQEITTTTTTELERTEYVETVIIGGGQAGLATAYHLAKKRKEYLVLDASERVGDSWRRRWPSLRLYSPARYDALPGMRFPAGRNSFPTGFEMADYLEAYTKRFQLQVESGVSVDRLSKTNGRYLIEAGDRRIEADNVVVA